jgi:hypothetical protein
LKSIWDLSGSVSVEVVSSVVGSVEMEDEEASEELVIRPPMLQDEKPKTTEAAVVIAKTLINICLFINIPLDYQPLTLP